MAGAWETRYFPAESPLHTLPAHCKIIALLVFICAVVATPREQFWAFGCYALLLGLIIARARVPWRLIIRRLTIELPFLIFALLLPFLAAGEKTVVFGLSVSVNGLLGAWNIVAKGTLGIIASGVFTATTQPAQILQGLQRLKAPDLILQIMSFMLRYTNVLSEEMRQMRIAQQSRGGGATGFRKLAIVSHSVTTLILRSFERGERVHFAMLSRGYNGKLPLISHQPAGRKQWLSISWLPMAAWIIASTAWVAAV